MSIGLYSTLLYAGCGVGVDLLMRIYHSYFVLCTQLYSCDQKPKFMLHYSPWAAFLELLCIYLAIEFRCYYTSNVCICNFRHGRGRPRHKLQY